MFLSHNTFWSAAKCISFTCHVFWSKCNVPAIKRHVRISLWCFFPETRKKHDLNAASYKNAPNYHHSYSWDTKEPDSSTIRSHEQYFLRTNRRLRELLWSTAERATFEFWRNTSPTQYLRLPFSRCYAPSHNEIYRKEIRELYKFSWKHTPVPQRINVISTYSSS